MGSRAPLGRWIHPFRRGQAGTGGRPLAESLSCGGGEMAAALFFAKPFQSS